MIAQMERLGAPQHLIDARKKRAEHFEVYPDNGDALEMFIMSSTQFRTGADGRMTGLDYSAVDLVLRAHEKDPFLLKDIQLIEFGALAELAKKRR